MPDTILIIGATGNVGRHIVGRLAKSNASIRVLVRKRGNSSLHGVEIAEGNLNDLVSLGNALSGIETVMLMWPLLTTDGAPEVLDAIARSARRLVYLSSVGVDSPEAPRDPIFSMHARMERLIEETDVAHTILRSDTIASNTLGWAHQIRTTGMVRGALTAATAVVDPRDLAKIAAAVLTIDRYVGQTYRLTGPRVISRPEQVKAIGAAIGRPLQFEEIAVEEARKQMVADGRPPALINALLAAAEMRSSSTLVTSDIEDISGQPARCFEQWAIDHADAFR